MRGLVTGDSKIQTHIPTLAKNAGHLVVASLLRMTKRGGKARRQETGIRVLGRETESPVQILHPQDERIQDDKSLAGANNKKVLGSLCGPLRTLCGEKNRDSEELSFGWIFQQSEGSASYLRHRDRLFPRF